MRESKRDIERLRHMQEAILRIEQYTQGVSTLEEFIQNGMVYYAVVMNITIIGEAANLLTFEFRETHPQTAWKQVIGMRNYIIHEYFQVDDVVVWDTIKVDIPLLHRQVNQYIDELKD